MADITCMLYTFRVPLHWYWQIRVDIIWHLLKRHPQWSVKCPLISIKKGIPVKVVQHCHTPLGFVVMLVYCQCKMAWPVSWRINIILILKGIYGDCLVGLSQLAASQWQFGCLYKVENYIFYNIVQIDKKQKHYCRCDIYNAFHRTCTRFCFTTFIL